MDAGDRRTSATAPSIDPTTKQRLEHQVERLQSQLRSKSREIADLNRTITELSRQFQILEKTLENKAREAEGWRQRAWRNLWTTFEL